MKTLNICIVELYDLFIYNSRLKEEIHFPIRMNAQMNFIVLNSFIQRMFKESYLSALKILIIQLPITIIFMTCVTTPLLSTVTCDHNLKA